MEKNIPSKIFPDSPSLYITKIKEKNTSKVPGSGCCKIKNPGTAIRKNTINLVLVSCILTPVVLRK